MLGASRPRAWRSRRKVPGAARQGARRCAAGCFALRARVPWRCVARCFALSLRVLVLSLRVCRGCCGRCFCA
ncbi:MAG: hypothetical protein DMF98_05020 [Acidobacteria bacterium]|nr:MAG: hypothetical protein DMF98_05020 [Acidobacteriota bacterium]